MDEFTRLLLAVVASRHGDTRLTARAREPRTTVFADLLRGISRPEQERADEEASELASRGVGAVLLGSPEYPYLLSRVRTAPPFLFYMGAEDLLTAQGITIFNCGSYRGRGRAWPGSPREGRAGTASAGAGPSPAWSAD
jgi:predicted Rossmann fold nucleotide-binding protein DprA/Smf involved in DNA uptake